MKKIYRATLKKINLSIVNVNSLTILICLLFTSYLWVFLTMAVSSENEVPEVIITPKIPHVGDTVVVKIAKDENEKSTPKLYFEETKYPVFELSTNWYRSFIPLSANSKPGKYPIEILYKGKIRKIELSVNDTKYLVETLTLPKSVAGLRASKIERELVNKALSIASEKKLWTGKFILPNSHKRSTPYGVKRKINGTFDPDYFHKGLDFAAPLGSNIIAPENSKVILAGQESKGFVVNGNCVFLDHGHGVITGYLHLSKLLVKDGDFVKKGQIIGKVGSSGIASGPHLHWGLYIFGKTVDPLNWLNTSIE